MNMTRWGKYRATFLLNCMGNGYIEEWNEFYISITKFISHMYNQRNITVQTLAASTLNMYNCNTCTTFNLIIL